jgi:hypothetical protein
MSFLARQPILVFKYFNTGYITYLIVWKLKSNVKMLYFPVLPDVRNRIALFDISETSSGCHSNTISIKMNTSGIIFTGESRNNRKKTCPSASLSTENLARIDPRSKTGVGYERSTTGVVG